MMTMQSNMTSLAEFIVASTFNRKAFVRDLHANTGRLLSGFSMQRKDVSQAAAEARARDTAVRTSNTARLRSDFQAERRRSKRAHAQMMNRLRKELALFYRALRGGDKTRHAEYGKSLRKSAKDQAASLAQDTHMRSHGVKDMLDQFAESRARMARAQSESLAGFGHEIERQSESIRREARQQLLRFKAARMDMADTLHARLHDDTAERSNNVDGLMRRFDLFQDEIRKDMQGAHQVFLNMRDTLAGKSFRSGEVS